MKRIGESNKNGFGTEMIIVNVIDGKMVEVEFQDEFHYKKIIEYGNFKKGSCRNPYDRTVKGVGYYGVGKYVSKIDGKHTLAYKKWRAMLNRCYDKSYSEKHPTYKDVIVCEEWHNFQVFAEWFYEHWYEIPGEIMDLDKDLLIDGNKVYSPDTCIIIPQSLNKMFCHIQNKKSGLPIGIKQTGKSTYQAWCSNGKAKEVYCGTFNNPEDAFYLGYVPMKRKLSQEKINSFKEYLPKNIYELLMNYKIKMYNN